MTRTKIDRKSVDDALAELEDLVQCRCTEGFKSRGLHDPNCQCDSANALATVRDALKAQTSRADDLAERLAEQKDWAGFLTDDLYASQANEADLSKKLESAVATERKRCIKAVEEAFPGSLYASNRTRCLAAIRAPNKE
ncbi:hypothetical protein [Roseicyclus marinus]|uniref:hypothetical protein n=1 Tax=Roseicyclus marinus TaxID=2161673 RepID=UPI00240EE157|nr:hypothetical protein [Roseicyclus marinus]MDG3040473.1 hypothetical protein [Roseicyclus marinus]